MGRNYGPGPETYNLPSTTGYKNHDNTKNRAPAYTFGEKLEKQGYGLGPSLLNIQGMTRHGKASSPAKTILRQVKHQYPTLTPSPTHYTPGNAHLHKSPSFSFGERTYRTPEIYRSLPPNIYSLPSSKPSPGVYAFPCRPQDKMEWGLPPNMYSLPPLNKYKQSSPHYSLGARLKTVKQDFTPSPNTYNSVTPKSTSLKIKMKGRFNDNQVTCLTMEDIRTPCM